MKTDIKEIYLFLPKYSHSIKYKKGLKSWIIEFK